MLAIRRRLLSTLFAVLASITLGGCGDSSHDAAMEASLDRWEELVEILEGIVDEESARAAMGRIEGWAAGTQASQDGLIGAGELSAEELVALSERFAARTEALGARMGTQVERLTLDPTLAPLFAEAMSEIPRTIGPLPR